MSRSGSLLSLGYGETRKIPSLCLTCCRLTDMPLPTDVLRDYTLEFEIRVERALADLRECLREAIRDRDCSRELVNTLMEDIEEMSSVQERELVALRLELN